jgi:hypothetical protein
MKWNRIVSDRVLAQVVSRRRLPMDTRLRKSGGKRDNGLELSQIASPFAHQYFSTDVPCAFIHHRPYIAVALRRIFI